MDCDRPVIARLPEILINQIAAGEVVERPASALKELVENSLDAGATRVDVLLKNGGMEEMAIVDNGCGMLPADLLLCIERHATSKIHSLEELESVASYGFRGEALASIASVSKLEIVSRVESSAAAYAVDVDFGVTSPLRPLGAPVGTKVTVRDLFSKLPVRQKFLKSAGTEFGACARVIRELALGNPGIDFFLHHQGRRVADYVGPSREDRFREAFKANWTPLRHREVTEGAELEIFLSPPEWEQDRGELLLFLNGRTIRNKGLLAAVRNAYLTVLGAHHEPSGAVYLDMRPEWVDVNVHPQKLEVRCLRQETLYPWILSTVRKAITRPVLKKEPLSSHLPVPLAESAPRAAAYQAPPPTFSPRVAEPARQFVFASETTPPSPARPARYLGVAGGRYLVCEEARGLSVIDLRLAARRARLLELREGGAAQGLLEPQLVRLPLDLVSVFEDNAECLRQVGFDAEPFGDGDYSLKCVPAGVASERAGETLISVLRALRGGAEGFAPKGDGTKLDIVQARLAELTCAQALAPTQALALVDKDGGAGYRFALEYERLEKIFSTGETA